MIKSWSLHARIVFTIRGVAAEIPLSMAEHDWFHGWVTGPEVALFLEGLAAEVGGCWGEIKCTLCEGVS